MKSILHHITRREAIKTSAAAAAVTSVPRHVLGGRGQTPPSDKLNIAGVGVGGMGSGDIRSFATENMDFTLACGSVTSASAVHRLFDWSLPFRFPIRSRRLRVQVVLYCGTLLYRRVAIGRAGQLNETVKRRRHREFSYG